MNNLSPKAISLLVMIVMSYVAYPQISKDLNSGELLQEAYAELQSGDTANAIEFFHAIHPNDTNYTLALLFEAGVYEEQKRFEECLAISKKGLEVADELESSFYLALGNSYTSMEQHDKALEIYDAGLKKYPYNHRLNFNKSIAYRNLGDYNKQMEFLQNTISIYPFYARAHRELGSIAIEQGKMSQALMAYAMSILVDPTAEGSNNALGYINQVVTEKPEIEEEGYNFPKGMDDYSDIDDIILNYVALQKKYKVKSKADLPIIRQLQVMMETMEYDASDKGYWMQTYVRFYKKLWEEDMFEPFSYYLMRASKNSKHKRLVNKKASKVEKFGSWAGVELNDYFNSIPISVKGKDVLGEKTYDDGISGIGKVKGENRAGYWYYFNESGSLYGEGAYDDNGLQTGLWKWYTENGSPLRSFEIKEGELDGKFTSYYEDGLISEEIEFEKGARNGWYKDYNRYGGLYSEMEYKDNKRVGKGRYYHPNGQLSYEFSRNEEEFFHGPYKQYYANGQLLELLIYKDGKIDSTATSYHANGQLKSRFEYSEGKANGDYEEYFANGELERKGKIDDGTVIGENLDYYQNGEIYQKNTYDIDGKINGLMEEFDRDGLKFKEFDYKKGNIVAYRFFNKEGSIIQQAEKKFGEFEFKGYYPDGVLNSEGTYDSKGGKMGEWKFYDKNGVVSSKGVYDDDKIMGEFLEYFPNGEVSEKANYEEGVWKGLAQSYYQNGQLYTETLGEEGIVVGGQIIYNRFGDTNYSNYYFQGQLHGWQLSYANTGKLVLKNEYSYGNILQSIYFDSLGVAYDTLDFRDSLIEYNFPNGNLRYRCAYKGGKKQGEALWYFPNGKLDTKGYYINGMEHGDWESYYPNGQLSKKYTYFMGEKDGEEVEYYDNGKMSDKSTYKLGMLDGPSLSYARNGNLTTEYHYTMNRSHGETKFYSPDGNLEHIRMYHHGKIVGYSYLGKDGKELAMIPITNETAEVKSYFQNGKIAREYQIKNGDFQGEYKKYYSNGTLYSFVMNTDGWNEGDLTIHYKNGKLKSKYPYKDNLIEGKGIAYYENGKVRVESYYLKGVRHGVWKYYNQSGKLTRIEKYYDGDIVEIEEM